MIQAGPDDPNLELRSWPDGMPNGWCTYKINGVVDERWQYTLDAWAAIPPIFRDATMLQPMVMSQTLSPIIMYVGEASKLQRLVESSYQSGGLTAGILDRPVIMGSNRNRINMVHEWMHVVDFWWQKQRGAIGLIREMDPALQTLYTGSIRPKLLALGGTGLYSYTGGFPEWFAETCAYYVVGDVANAALQCDYTDTARQLFNQFAAWFDAKFPTWRDGAQLPFPTVTTHPQSVTTAPYVEVTFTAAASGTPAPTIKWEASIDGGATWINTSGVTNQATYKFTPIPGQSRMFRALFTNHWGGTVSNPATLTVT